MSLFKRVQERKAAGQPFDQAAADARAAEAAAQAAPEPGHEVVDGELPSSAAGIAAMVAAVRTAPRPSIFRSHRLRIIAQHGSVLAAKGVASSTRAANDDNAPATTEEAEVRLQLLDHKRSLKAIQSREAKIALKRDILPLYAPWCDGVLSADSGADDEVLATVLIWRIDVGDYFEALPLIDYVLRHKLELPAHIDRTPATFITEEIAEAAIKAYDAGGDAATNFPAGILSAIEELVDDEDPDLRADMPDEVRAKLQKAIGRAVLFAGDDDRNRQEETLKRYQRALELDPKSGVKKQVEALQRKLRPETTPAAPPVTPTPTETPPATAAQTQSPAPEGEG